MRINPPVCTSQIRILKSNSVADATKFSSPIVNANNDVIGPIEFPPIYEISFYRQPAFEAYGKQIPSDK